ncbi:hypothetical protein C8J57DRAFT_1230014 [Mycena rebaudengoi]|nr:hypothetical protein C8J57DRAFT_1230014 [Mycena rebaudengoi]
MLGARSSCDVGGVSASAATAFCRRWSVATCGWVGVPVAPRACVAAVASTASYQLFRWRAALRRASIRRIGGGVAVVSGDTNEEAPAVVLSRGGAAKTGAGRAECRRFTCGVGVLPETRGTCCYEPAGPSSGAVGLCALVTDILRQWRRAWRGTCGVKEVPGAKEVRRSARLGTRRVYPLRSAVSGVGGGGCRIHRRGVACGGPAQSRDGSLGGGVMSGLVHGG